MSPTPEDPPSGRVGRQNVPMVATNATPSTSEPHTSAEPTTEASTIEAPTPVAPSSNKAELRIETRTTKTPTTEVATTEVPTTAPTVSVPTPTSRAEQGLTPSHKLRSSQPRTTAPTPNAHTHPRTVEELFKIMFAKDDLRERGCTIPDVLEDRYIQLLSILDITEADLGLHHH